MRPILLLRGIKAERLVVASSWISRLVAMACQMFSMRILLRTLGADDYSLFIVLTSLAPWFLLLDFGLGNSLQNSITELNARGQSEESQITTGVILLLVGTIAVTTLFVWLHAPLADIYLRKFESAPRNVLRSLFLANGLILIFYSAGMVSVKIFYGRHVGHIANILMALNPIASLCAYYFISFTEIFRDKLFAMICAANITNGSIFLLCLGFIFLKARKKCKTSGKPVFEIDAARSLLKRGLRFFSFGATAALVLQIDYIVISQHLSSEQTIQYNFIMRIYLAAFFFYSSMLMAYWPTFTKAITLKNTALIRKNSKLLLLIGVGVIGCCLAGMLIGGDFLAGVFLGTSDIEVPSQLTLLFAALFLIRIWTDLFSMLLHSMNHMSGLQAMVIVQALISAGGQFFLAQTYGAAGILLALIASFLLTTSWALPVFSIREIQRRIT